MIKKVDALLVTYNPDIVKLEDNLLSVLSQVNRIIMYDNNSKNIDKIKEIVHKFSRIQLIINTSNLGLSICYNNGIKDYLNESEFVLIMDQDSKFDRDYVCKLLNYYQSGIGILIGSYSNSISKGNAQYSKFAINSGSLIYKKVFDNNIRYDESLFLDLVDIDFSIQLRNFNLKILNVDNIKYTHTIGDSTNNKFTYNHNYIRKFLICKNTILVAKKYTKFKYRLFGINLIEHLKYDAKNKFYTNLFVAIIRNIKRMIFTLLFEKDKIRKVLSIGKSFIYLIRNP
jgi:rhamnosyltransferase